MPERQTTNQPARQSKPSEDWISVIVGLLIVLIVVLLNVTSIPWPLFGVLR